MLPAAGTIALQQCGTIQQLLAALELSKWAPVFEQQDFVRTIDLKGLQDNDLKALGLTLGPRLRILKALRVLGLHPDSESAAQLQLASEPGAAIMATDPGPRALPATAPQPELTGTAVVSPSQPNVSAAVTPQLPAAVAAVSTCEPFMLPASLAALPDPQPRTVTGSLSSLAVHKPTGGVAPASGPGSERTTGRSRELSVVTLGHEAAAGMTADGATLSSHHATAHLAVATGTNSAASSASRSGHAPPRPQTASGGAPRRQWVDVFVHGFPRQWGEAELRGHFERCTGASGAINSVTVMPNKRPGSTKGWGFVRFAHMEPAVAAVSIMHGSFAGPPDRNFQLTVNLRRHGTPLASANVQQPRDQNNTSDPLSRLQAAATGHDAVAKAEDSKSDQGTDPVIVKLRCAVRHAVRSVLLRHALADPQQPNFTGTGTTCTALATLESEPEVADLMARLNASARDSEAPLTLFKVLQAYPAEFATIYRHTKGTQVGLTENPRHHHDLDTATGLAPDSTSVRAADAISLRERAASVGSADCVRCQWSFDAEKHHDGSLAPASKPGDGSHIHRNRSLMIRNLNKHTPAYGLKDRIEAICPTEHVHIFTHKRTGESQGCARVLFASHGGAVTALTALDNSRLDGNTLSVTWDHGGHWHAPPVARQNQERRPMPHMTRRRSRSRSRSRTRQLQ